MKWAREACFYHLMIDRFATGRQRFDFAPKHEYGEALRGWMGGDLAGLIRSLDYLAWLGVDAVLLSPFFKGEKYHGYWTTEYYLPDPHFGSVDDVRMLIRESHRRGLRVIMDFPFTHCHKSAPAAADALAAGVHSPYHDWFVRDVRGCHTGFFGDRDLPEFDLDRPVVREEMKRILDYWLPFGFDGIRFDHAKRPSRCFWEDLSRYLKERHPRVQLLGENWQDSGTVGPLSPFLHGELNVPVSSALRKFLAEPGTESLREIFSCVGEQRRLRQQGYLLPTYLDSHDLERAGDVAGNRMEVLKTAFLIQMTLPYPPVLYYGSERGQRQSMHPGPDRYERDRFFREPMDWRNGVELLSWVRSLLLLRRRHLRFFHAEPDVMIAEEGRGSYAYDEGGRRLSVVIHCNGMPRRAFVVGGQEMSLLRTEHAEVLLFSPSGKGAAELHDKESVRAYRPLDPGVCRDS